MLYPNDEQAKTPNFVTFRSCDCGTTKGAVSKRTTSMSICSVDPEPMGWQRQVESACSRQGLHLTPLRRRVLAILAESSAPLGAYAIIDQLSRREGKQVAPPTVYRTLEFFLDHGFVHKIESRNAYAPCEHLGHAHHGVLLFCEKCGRSDEIEDVGVDRLLRETAARAGFAPHRQMIELLGRCQNCAPEGGPSFTAEHSDR
jgi:Fur family transcriptional regulator, zinc uptake regulator